PPPGPPRPEERRPPPRGGRATRNPSEEIGMTERPTAPSGVVRKSTNVRAVEPAKVPGSVPPGVRLTRMVLAGLAALSPRLAGRYAERLFFTPPRPRKSRAGL